LQRVPELQNCLRNDPKCQIYADTAGAKKWVGNLPVCASTVAAIRTRCMSVVLCMQLWKSKLKLVLRNVDTSLT